MCNLSVNSAGNYFVITLINYQRLRGSNFQRIRDLSISFGIFDILFRTASLAVIIIIKTCILQNGLISLEILEIKFPGETIHILYH